MGLKIHELKQMPLFLAEDPSFFLLGIKNLKLFGKNLAKKIMLIIFAVLQNDAALVKGLRRLPFTEESRVRFPYVVQQKPFINERLFSFPTHINN